MGIWKRYYCPSLNVNVSFLQINLLISCLFGFNILLTMFPIN